MESGLRWALGSSGRNSRRTSGREKVGRQGWSRIFTGSWGGFFLSFSPFSPFLTLSPSNCSNCLSASLPTERRSHHHASGESLFCLSVFLSHCFLPFLSHFQQTPDFFCPPLSRVISPRFRLVPVFYVFASWQFVLCIPSCCVWYGGLCILCTRRCFDYYGILSTQYIASFKKSGSTVEAAGLDSVIN